MPFASLSIRILVVSLLLATGGCAKTARINHKSVAELYGEAVERARISKASIANQVQFTENTDIMYPVVSQTESKTKLASEQTLAANSAAHPESKIGSVTQTRQQSNPGPESLADSASPTAQSILAALQELMAIKQIEQNNLPVVSANWNFGQAPVVTGAAPELLQGALPSRVETTEFRPRINEVFEQTDIREAIDILASTTGETVVVDDTVGGVVSVQIKDADFEEALSTLLLPLGLVYAKRDEAFLIAPPDPGSPLFGMISERTQYVPVNHPPTKLASLLPKRLGVFYQASDERNLIAIDAPHAIGEDLVSRLQELDIPVQQVVLEAIVCVTSPNSGFLFGVDWNHTLRVSSADQLNVGMSGLAFSGAGSPFGVHNAFADFAVTTAFVQLLAQQGYVTIRAAPRVTAKDGEKASIAIERETFFSLQPAGANVLFRQDVQKVDAGITLMITPRIRGDMVSVEIERAEVSEDIRNSDPSNAINRNPFPVINRRIVSTKVDVMDGQTIVIGGLVQRQTVEQIDKIPFLGSIPVLGAFFRKVSKQEQETEVAIFISPRIVRNNLPTCKPASRIQPLDLPAPE